MARQIFAYILHEDGVADDTALELIAAARRLDAGASVTALVFGDEESADKVSKEVSAIYPEVFKVADKALAYPNAEIIRKLLARILPEKSILIMPHEHFAMDLAPGLSVLLNGAYLPDASGLEPVEGDLLKAVREEFSGMVSTHVLVNVSDGAVITVRPGIFEPDDDRSQNGRVVDKTAEALEGGIPECGRRFIEVVEAEAGDVDITKEEVLVSVGRGIEDQDNLEIVFDLAEAVGGEVSCSRPIVDAKWLEKARQVGTSGQTVKPKVYMALGISGSFQHLGGIKGSPFMVAVNKNPKAPIFQVADIGVVADILDFVPELTDAVNDMKG